MKYTEFKNKYLGKFVDWDGRYGFQCMDLFRAYMYYVLKINPYALPGVTYAKQVFTNFKPNPYFTKIKNTPTGVPKQGDVIFWGWHPGVTGKAGHVAIFDEGGVYNFISLEQNYPIGSGVHLQRHNYKGVLGWLRPKTT